MFFFFSSRRRHTRYWRDWSSDVCASDLRGALDGRLRHRGRGHDAARSGRGRRDRAAVGRGRRDVVDRRRLVGHEPRPGARSGARAPAGRAARALAVFDAAAYLDRIRYAGPTEPTAETLAALHRAHMLAVPFENLDIHLGVRNVLDPDHVFDKVVRRRRGGWCFELNVLFALLLEHLGYRVTRCAAAVVLSEPGTPDFAHLTLR